MNKIAIILASIAIILSSIALLRPEDKYVRADLDEIRVAYEFNIGIQNQKFDKINADLRVLASTGQEMTGLIAQLFLMVKGY